MYECSTCGREFESYIGLGIHVRKTHGRSLKTNECNQGEITKRRLEKLYVEEKKGSVEIARILGVSKPTVLKKLAEYGIETRSPTYAHRYHLKENKPHFAYIFGVIAGDGYIRERKKEGYEVGLKTSSLHFNYSFKQSLEKLGLNPSLVKLGDQYKNAQYRTVAYSIDLCEKIREKDFSEFESEEEKKSLIRGFYESEGWNSIEIPNLWTVGMCSSNTNLLRRIDGFLRDLGYDFNYRKRKNSSDELRSRRSKQNRRFLEDIKPCIKNERIQTDENELQSQDS